MPAQLTTLEPEVTITAVAAALSSSNILAQSIILVADSTNTGTAYIGGSDVNADNGIPLAAGGSLVLSDDKGHSNLDIDLNEIYVIGTANDLLRVNYIVRTSQ